MNKARQPAPCVKCGESTWNGPQFAPKTQTVNDPMPERLSWTCSGCGFKTWTLPLDAKYLAPVG